MDREINLTFGNEDNTDKPTELQDQIELADNSLRKDTPKSMEVQLSPEEQEQVLEFAKKIDLRDTNNILQYGVGAQSQIANFSDKTLASVRTKDLGEVGDLLSNVVTELKNFDTEEEDKGILGFFKRGTNKALALKTRYDKTETNIEAISAALNEHQIQLMKDVAKLDEMYEINESYFKELSMYILAGKKRLDEAYANELPVLQKKAADSNLAQDAQAVNDFQAALTRFEKKIHDLELTRMVSLQMAPQIRMIQASDSVMIEKIQSTIVNTIPLWKTQMSLALSALHTGQAAKAQKEVTDFTNELMKKNADDLAMATVETAKASERGVVDIETLQHTNEQLINALNEVRDIQIEGHKQRQQASAELMRLEGELKKSLLDIAQK